MLSLPWFYPFYLQLEFAWINGTTKIKTTWLFNQLAQSCVTSYIICIINHSACMFDMFASLERVFMYKSLESVMWTIPRLDNRVTWLILHALFYVKILLWTGTLHLGLEHVRTVQYNNILKALGFFCPGKK